MFTTIMHIETIKYQFNMNVALIAYSNNYIIKF